MYAVVQTGSRTLRSASATKRRICRSFWAWTDGAAIVADTATEAAPQRTCRRVMPSIVEFLCPFERGQYSNDIARFCASPGSCCVHQTGSPPHICNEPESTRLSRYSLTSATAAQGARPEAADFNIGFRLAASADLASQSCLEVTRPVAMVF